MCHGFTSMSKERYCGDAAWVWVNYEYLPFKFLMKKLNFHKPFVYKLRFKFFRHTLQSTSGTWGQLCSVPLPLLHNTSSIIQKHELDTQFISAEFRLRPIWLYWADGWNTTDLFEKYLFCQNCDLYHCKILEGQIKKFFRHHILCNDWMIKSSVNVIESRLKCGTMPNSQHFRIYIVSFEPLSTVQFTLRAVMVWILFFAIECFFSS